MGVRSVQSRWRADNWECSTPPSWGTCSSARNEKLATGRRTKGSTGRMHEIPDDRFRIGRLNAVVLLLVLQGPAGFLPFLVYHRCRFLTPYLTFFTRLISASCSGHGASCTSCMLMTHRRMSIVQCSAADAVASVDVMCSAIDPRCGWMVSNRLRSSQSIQKPNLFGRRQLASVDHVC